MSVTDSVTLFNSNNDELFSHRSTQHSFYFFKTNDNLFSQLSHFASFPSFQMIDYYPKNEHFNFFEHTLHNVIFKDAQINFSDTQFVSYDTLK